MPVFFLNVRVAGELVADEGREYATDEAAVADALAGIREMVAEDIKFGRRSTDWSLELTSKAGAVLDILDAQDALVDSFQKFIPRRREGKTER